jgi:hypothetical protein
LLGFPPTKEHAFLYAKTIAALFVSLLVSSPGCSGGSGGSGVDTSKTVSTVTPDEATTICEYGKLPLSESEYQKGVCTYVGLEQGGSPEGCQIVFEQCMLGPFDQTFSDCSAAAGSVSNLPDCAALITVGELENCLYAETARAASEVASISCDTPLDELPEFSRPAQCDKLDELCPTLFDF